MMTLEAAAGKNPVNHVGKLYHLVAGRIASSIIAELRGIEDAACLMVSEIGCPVHDPEVVDIALVAGGAPLTDTLRRVVADIAHVQLGRMSALRDELLAERLTLY
jgi:S-adenosylmethionine synthetase